MTLDNESLPENEFEEVRRIALEVANRRKEREKSESSSGGQNGEGGRFGAGRVLGYGAGVVAALVGLWYKAFPSFMRWKKRFAGEGLAEGEIPTTFWTPAWVRERVRAEKRLRRGWKGEAEFDVAYARQDSWYNCLRAALRAGVRWRELTGQRDPDAGVDGLLRDFGREVNQEDDEGLRSEADLRKACKERFEDAQPGEFLTPVREATIFLHREVT